MQLPRESHGQHVAVRSLLPITELLYLQFPFLETLFDVKLPWHVPVLGQKFVSKIREVIGIVGPQAKKIYEVYV